jgi:hypothetical protein
MKLQEQISRIHLMMGVINEDTHSSDFNFVRRRIDVIESIIEQYKENNQYTKCDMRWSEYWDELEDQVTIQFYWEVVLDLKIEQRVWEQISDIVLDILKQEYYTKIKNYFDTECK